MKIFILPLAMQRMEEIYDYIFPFNAIAAVRVYNDILDIIEKLESFPLMGHVERQLADCGKIFRSLDIRNYKVIYYIEDAENAIYVATVWDCRQNPSKLSKEI
jgi:plasmid stabilization system protein ParE